MTGGMQYRRKEREAEKESKKGAGRERVISSGKSTRLQRKSAERACALARIWL
jgi:hypothetical protein